MLARCCGQKALPRPGTLRALKVISMNFAADTSGAVSVISALVLPILIGMAGLSLEYGNALLVEAETQRVADIASYSAAVAYTQDGGDQAARRAAANAVAQSISQMNGIDPERVQVGFEAGDDGSDSFVRALITSDHTLLLSRILGPDELTGTVLAVAQIGGDSGPACILAVNDEGQGLYLSGSSNIAAADCAVASNAVVKIPHCYAGVAIEAEKIYYGTLDVPQNCGGDEPFQDPQGGPSQLIQQQTEDYIALERASALALAAGYFPLPTVPPGAFTGELSLAYNQSLTISRAASAGCESAVYLNNTWTLTCSQNVSVGKLSVGGGITAVIRMVGDARLFNVTGDIVNGGTSLSIGDGSPSLEEINIGGSVSSNGGGCTIFGRADTVRVSGNINLSGSAIFRGGKYLVDDYFNAGSGGNCSGRQGIVSTNVTWIIRGMSTCGTSSVFCISGGGNDFGISAPSDGPFSDFAIIGPLDPAIRRGIQITNIAAGGLVKGVVYAPNSKVDIGGAGSASAPAGHCFQLVAAEIVISGSGRINAGNCPGFSGGGSDALVRLVR